MKQQINQVIEQIKANLTDYQSQLQQIDLESEQEKKSLFDAILIEQAEIKSLLDKYRQIKQKNEIEVVRSSYKHLADFKQDLLSKIQLETKQAAPKSQPQQINNSNSDTTIPVSESEDELPKKSETDLHDSSDPEEAREAILAEAIALLDRSSPEELVKLYPRDISRMLPNFDVNDTLLRDKLLEHYQQSNRKTYISLIKLYQKPNLDDLVAIPPEEKMSAQEKKHHNFILANYPNALPHFWFLVDSSPKSIRYVATEFAAHHIIITNSTNISNTDRTLSMNLEYLLSLNNESNLSDFLRDLFLNFHPKRFDPKNNTQSIYFSYINDIIIKQSTLEHGEILQLWTHMKETEYKIVASDSFSPPKFESN